MFCFCVHIHQEEDPPSESSKEPMRERAEHLTSPDLAPPPDLTPPPGPSPSPLLQLLTGSSPRPSPRCSNHSLRFSSDTDSAPSPPNSQPYILYHGRGDWTEESDQTPPSISSLTRHIQTLKKKVRRFEDQFELEMNYKPSHNDKYSNPEMVRVMNELMKARKQLKGLVQVLRGRCLLMDGSFLIDRGNEGGFSIVLHLRSIFIRAVLFLLKHSGEFDTELYSNAVEEVTGSVQSAHQWVNMTDVTVQINETHTARTCKPALGHSFAAGTTDGGGDLNFTQGAVEGDPFWDGIRDALVGPPSNETQECHHPKPILFSTGEMNWPLPWHPQIVDVQIITIGSVAIVAIPGEMT